MFSSRLVSIFRFTVGALLLGSVSTAILTHAAQAEVKKPVVRYVFKFSTTWWPPEIDAKIRAKADELGVDYQADRPGRRRHRQTGRDDRELRLAKGRRADRI